MADYFTNRTGMPFNESGNTTPQTTTISTDETGKTTVTQKQVLDKNKAEALAAPEVQNPMQFVTQPSPQQYIDLSGSQGPQDPAMSMPVAPPDPRQQAMMQQQRQQMQQQAQQQAMLQAAAQTPVAQGTQTPETFQRMLQAESGGRQFNPDGSIITSPKGAMGIAQIMPATAAQPGYGIKPATPQELATPEGNANFGQRYFEGMYTKFGNDPEKAAAAYNAGPGTIEKAMLVASQQGGTWKDYIPAETKTYLEKVFKGSEETKKRFEPLIAGIPSSDVGMTPTEQAIYHLTLNSKDVNALGQVTYAGDHLVDKATKRAAADEHAAVLERNRMEQKAQKRAADLVMAQGNGMQRALRDESEEGSYLQAYLFKRLGRTDLAQAEQRKLGGDDMWAQTMVTDENGKTQAAWVKFRNGAPIKGYNADGELNEKQLLSAQSAKGGLDIVGGSYINDQTKEVGRLVTNKTTGQSYIQTDTGNKPMAGFRPQASTGSLADMKARQIQEVNIKLQGKTKEEQMAILRDYNKKLVGQGLDPIQPNEIGLTAPQIDAGQTTSQQAQPTQQVGSVQANQAAGNAVVGQQGGPAVPQMPQTQPAPQTAPAQGPAVPVQGPAIPVQRPTMSQLESQAAAQKKEAEVVGEDIGKVRANIGKIKENADYLTTKIDELIADPGFKYNVGVADIKGVPIPFGSTIAGMIPGTESTDFKIRFDEIKGQQFLQGIEQLKGTGAITDREGEAAKKAISRMSLSQSEKEFRKAADDFQSIIKRGVDRNLIKAGQEPIYGTPPASEQKRERERAAPGTKENPIKL